MSTPPGAPRIFGIVATASPVVAVLRRGPTDWFHVGRWDLAAPRYEPGAWFHGALYPQKCDLSPDGRWLAYSAMKVGAAWPAGEIYEAISRLPWLTALAAWEAGTTYTTGIHFDGEAGVDEVGEPDVGDVEPVLRRYGLRPHGSNQFAVERLRGWTESPATPAREVGGPWDEHRRVEMHKTRPGGAVTLVAAGGYAGFRTAPTHHDPPMYSLSAGDEVAVLGGVQWADWDPTGRLLVATTIGALQIRELAGLGSQVIFEHDLAAMTPDPQPPPSWVAEW